MRIGIDSTYLDVSYKTGIFYYLRNLLMALARLDHENEYILYYNSFIRQSKRFFSPGERFRIQVLKCPNILEKLLGRDFFFQYFSRALTSALQTDECDVLHAPHLRGVFLPGVSTVVTINDLAFMALPEYGKGKEADYLKRRLEECGRHAQKVIAISEFTRNEIWRYTSIPKHKIEVVPYGCDPIFQKLADFDEHQARKKFELWRPFILTVSSIEPRKNLKILLEAFLKLKQRKRVPHKLVIIGSAAVMSQNVFRDIRPLLRKLGEDVILRGAVENEDLVYFYNLCDVFVFPSLYEGFGLPLLEAMACGCAIVSSSSASLPEVAEHSVLFANHADSTEFYEKIYSILEDDKLKSELSEKALARAKAFSWDRTAEQTKSIYEGRV